MPTLELIIDVPITGPDCRKCSATTRRVGLEGHPVLRDFLISTFQCNGCGTVQVTLEHF